LTYLVYNISLLFVSVAGDAAAATPGGTHEELILDFLPEKPIPLPETSDSAIQWIGDPPLEALGLASWWPSGRVQYLLEYLHVGYDIPWWGVIAISKSYKCL
jgi:hypothetical protein